MPRRKKYTGDVIPKSQMFPMSEPERQNTATEPLVRRLDVAGAKLEKMQQQIEENKGLTPKILRNLGKVTLEFEQVNNNLDSLRGTILRDMSAKRRFMRQERKLIKEEKKVIEETSQNISISRIAFGALAGISALDNLKEGDIGGFLGNSLLAGAVNADIVSSIVGGLGLGALLRGRGAQTASRVTQGAGMSKGMGLMKHLKNPKIGIPLALLSLLGLSQMGKANASEPMTSTGTGIDKKDLSRFDTLNQKFQAALLPLIKLTNKSNILASAMTDAQELKNLSDEDFKWLAFGVSAEAARGTDDEHAVAASILNRVSSKHFPNSVKEVVLQENQFEAVTKERAFHDKKLQKQLSSLEGQDKIAKALALLEGRTDFKGQSQLKNRVPSEDPMFDEKGNFFHYWWQQPGAVKPEGWEQPNFQQFMSINQDPDVITKTQENTNMVLPMMPKRDTPVSGTPPSSPGTGSLQCFPEFKSVDEFACNLLLGAGT